MNIDITDKGLQIISTALEVYSRMQTGQFTIALQEAFPERCWELDHAVLSKLEKGIQKVVTPELIDEITTYSNSGCCDDGEAPLEDKGIIISPDPRARYHGIFQTNEDSQTAWSIKKTIDEYVSVKNNDGYWGSGVSFHGPIEECEEFEFLENEWRAKRYNIFKDQEYVTDYMRYCYGKPCKDMWDYVDELFPKEERDFYSCESMEIGLCAEGWLLFVHKPQK